MSRAGRIKWGCAAALALAVILPLGSSRAADGEADKDVRTAEGTAKSTAAPKSTSDKSAARTIAAEKRSVDLFDAMRNGDLDVKFVAKNSHDGRLLIKNNTDQPLSVKLPDAFAAVPVLAQNAGGGAGGGTRSSRSSNSQNNQNQSVGGGLGGGGGGGGGGRGGGGGAFDVATEKVAKINVQTVCLEHGKKEPSSGGDLRDRADRNLHQRPERPRALQARGQRQCKPAGGTSRGMALSQPHDLAGIDRQENASPPRRKRDLLFSRRNPLRNADYRSCDQGGREPRARPVVKFARQHERRIRRQVGGVNLA